MIDTEYIKKLEQKYNLGNGELQGHLEDARKMNMPLEKKVIVSGKEMSVEKTAMGPVETEDGLFYQINFSVDDQWRDYKVIAKAQLDPVTKLPTFNNADPLYVRLDSGCEPGQIFGDKMCDCQEQLELAMKQLGESYQGLIIHIPGQDGRGKGTDFHLATLHLQRLGLNTVESFKVYSNDDTQKGLDERTYEGAIGVLKFLGINSGKLNCGTNNPLKIQPLEENGYEIDREPVLAGRSPYTARHLEAKSQELGHLLSGK